MAFRRHLNVSPLLEVTSHVFHLLSNRFQYIPSQEDPYNPADKGGKKTSSSSSFFSNTHVTVIRHVRLLCLQQKQSSPVLFQVDCQVSTVNGQLVANRIRIKLWVTHQLLVTDNRLIWHSRFFFFFKSILCAHSFNIFISLNSKLLHL